MMLPVTRIAPTPSGFLHGGNRLNFQTTADLADALGARLVLRIDDVDAARYRREYVDDIFTTLQDMGITWHSGPCDADDFEQHWSQRRKTEYYGHELTAARDRGLPVYACACSRTQQRGPATGGCVGGCRDQHLALVTGETALRIAIPTDTMVQVGDTTVDLASRMGDFVVWRRDGLPSYQFVSVIEDRDLGVTHIVRGEDLLHSSAAQIHLAAWLNASGVAGATYVHHGLVTDAAGMKLSKSTLNREEGTP